MPERTRFTVQPVEPGTVLRSVRLPNGRTLEIRSPHRTTYAVVDEHGIVWEPNPVTQKGSPSLYPQRRTAQRLADEWNDTPPSFDVERYRAV